MFKTVDVDVVVIGAGLSGLTSAYHLLEKEPYLRVIILESSNRVGGRLITIPLSVKYGSSIMCFSIGGSWLSGEQNTFLSLLEKLEIPIVVNAENRSGKIIVDYDGNIHLLDSGTNIMNFLSFSEKIQLTKFILNVELICRNIRERNDLDWITELKNTNLKTFIRKTIQSDSLLSIIEFMIYLYCGVDTSQVSALFYIFFCISTKGIVNQLLNERKNLYEVRMKTSPSDICDRLSKAIGREYILTEQHVSKISFDGKYVEVSTNDDFYCCYNVIIAVSPDEILNIKFSPDLSKEKYHWLNGISSHPITTFLATYQEVMESVSYFSWEHRRISPVIIDAFWQEKNLSGDIYVFNRLHKRGPIDFCWNISSFDAPVLYGRIFSAGSRYENKDVILEESILEELSAFFGEAALYPTDFYEKTWHGNSSQMFCGESGPIIMDADLDERIHWAGSETSAEWYGQLAGAVHSGIRAALEVLYDLRPSVLTPDDLIFLSPTQRSLKKSQREYGSRIHSIMAYVVEWKTYIPLSVLVVLLLWRIKVLLMN